MFKIIDHPLSRSPIGNLRCFLHQIPTSSIALFALLLIALLNDDGQVVGLLLGAKPVTPIELCESWDPASL
jgi:hypothetical protein